MVSVGTTQVPSDELRVAVLVKQIPSFEEMTLGADGRLVRAGVDLEMNAYCRRAVAKAVELVAEHGGSATVLTMGPPSADQVLREAIAWAEDRGVAVSGVHLCDGELAGSDTLASARALAAALELAGPFDLVLVGRNSVDADTGQVGPQVAALLDVPFATGVRELTVDPFAGSVSARCEHDDGWVKAALRLPAVLSTAERLTEPCKVDAARRAAVDPAAIRRLGAPDLGPGPWGEAGSPTRVGTTRRHPTTRRKLVFSGSVESQTRAAVAVLRERGALSGHAAPTADEVPAPGTGTRVVGILVEPDRPHLTRELLGAGAVLACRLGASVTALGPQPADPVELGSWGADAFVHLVGSDVEEDLAAAVTSWATAEEPAVILAPSTAWGREIAARVAVTCSAGLVGDAIALEVENGQLVAWKPAFGGQLVAAITCLSPVQMATVRAGALPRLRPRRARAAVQQRRMHPRGRLAVVTRERDDDLDVLADSPAVIGIGAGVTPDDLPLLKPLADALDAQIAATRKVTDRGWLPRARQIGITGRTIAPRLYVAIGASGKFNHTVGFARAGTVLAVNSDPGAPIFGSADVGMVGDWREIVGLLTAALAP